MTVEWYERDDGSWGARCADCGATAPTIDLLQHQPDKE